MRTSADWLRHFETNARQLRIIPWERGAELTTEESAAIASSVAEFQRGESGEGRHLIRYAIQYAELTGDLEYVGAIRLFIREEQRHARDLARFFTLNGIPLARASFADAVFRRLRNLLGTLEMSIAVLITAELMAQVYYDRLGVATQSTILRRLCEQILDDEARHVEFQAERLGMLRARRGKLGYLATMAFQRMLFAATSVVVWHAHRRAFRQADFAFVQFWKGAWCCFDAAFRISSQARAATRYSRRPAPPPLADAY
ncbi:MAG TPA: ferritin-like domain-containing protein [Gemmatimonadaceae bacterium]|nr:ferritin-like domain-containing protein [Gemmatimonadaceae bacterium]